MQGGDAEVAEAVTVAQHDEGLSPEILEGQRFGSGAGMIPGQHREEWLGANGKQLQVFVTQRRARIARSSDKSRRPSTRVDVVSSTMRSFASGYFFVKIVV